MTRILKAASQFEDTAAGRMLALIILIIPPIVLLMLNEGGLH